MTTLAPSPPKTEPFRPTLRSGRKRATPAYYVRVAIASVAIALWGLFSVYFAWDSWLRGVQQQAAGVRPISASDVDRANAPTYRVVLQTARATCPQGVPFLLVNDGGAIKDLGNYYLYPRRIISIEPDDPFGADDLTANRGGCIADFGPRAAERLEPFRDRLARVICAEEGCLYIIK